ncbi:hypothetical protein [Catenulispora subtropica]|uniref:Endonuclease/exonuclease/phosphatase domain-containing protein n=1 Tax=Catenulispora subtropica TaxID=450798 RepID=A0ABP5C348_9ACTN
MPNIRVLQWNIRKFGQPKSAIPGMLRAISHTIVGANADIAIILEPTGSTGVVALQALAADLRVIDGANHWALTYTSATGRERYGFLCRNLNLVRFTAVTNNVHVAAPPADIGTVNHPVRNLEEIDFTTWPANFGAPFPAPLPAPPRQPLLDLFAVPPRARMARLVRFGGQPAAQGGLAQGIGARLPCLALFHIHTPAGNHYYLPIVVCHFYATRSSHAHNGGATRQIAQMKFLHAVQKYAFRDLAAAGPPPVECGYLSIDGAAVPVRELIITGDWNVDFKQNLDGGRFLEQVNHNAFVTLTPTPQNGGSAAVPLLVGTAVAGPGALPAGGPPIVPFQVPAAPPTVTSVPNQALRSAVTRQGTILLQYNAANARAVAGMAPGNLAALRDCCYDLTFYGGTQVSGAAMLTPAAGGSPADAGLVVDVPASIVPGPAAPGGLAPGQVWVGQIQNYYANRIPPLYNADQAPALNQHPAVLTLTDRWIGANLISDHVPTVLQFTCP